MTPIEKAKELFTNYLILFPEFYNDLEYGYNDVKAKQCALIAVDELIYETQFEVPNIRQRYWKEVKQEIEKL
jgi:hypothetical protein